MDVDIGFLNPQLHLKASAKLSNEGFTRAFSPKENWWLVKKLFQNPYACVKVIFLDKKLINQLRSAAKGDPEWAKLGHHLRHVRGHRHHFHVRLSGKKGLGVCPDTTEQDLELDAEEEDWENPGLPGIPGIVEGNEPDFQWSLPEDYEPSYGATRSRSAPITSSATDRR